MSDKDPLDLFGTDVKADPLALFSEGAQDPLGLFTQRETTLGEDFQIGIGNAASTLVKGAGLLAAGGIGRMLPQSVQDQMFKMTGDVAKDTTEYWTPKDAKQTLGGKLTTAVTTLPMQMMAMPFSPADTGMTMIDDGEDVKTAMLGATVDTIGNAGGMLMGNGSGGILSRMALGAVGNAGQELATKQLMQSIVKQDASKEKWAPNTDDALVAGVMGAGFGMLPNKPEVKAPKMDETPSAPILEKPFTETLLANELLSILDKEIATQSSSLNRLNDLYAKNNIPIIGDDNPVVKLEKELAHLKLKRESLVKDLDGNIEARTATEEAIKNKAPDKIASARTQRLLDTINKKIDYITNSIYEPDSPSEYHQQAIAAKRNEIDRLTRQKDMLEVLLGGKKREEVPTNTLVPDDAEARAMASIEAAKTIEPEGIKQVDAMPETDPWVVAKQKIDQAAGMSVAQRADRILETEEKLANTPPEKTALREALAHEIKTLEEMNKPEQITAPELPREPIKNKINPSSDEVTQLLLDHKTVGEVLETLRKEDLGTPAQKILIQILQKIGHVTRAAFAVRAAELSDKNGKPASGMYTSGPVHEVAIHPGATIKTILHEAVHAATVAVLDHGTNVYAKRMNVLYEKYKHLDKGEYGFTNVKEFVSEALTNKSFQTLLAGIKSDNILGKTPTSLWTSLKRTIADALGVPPEVRTALDDILDASSEVMNKTHTAGESFYKKMSEVEGDKVTYDKLDEVLPRTFRRSIGRNAFGINSLEGFYRDKPKVQKAYKLIMQASDYADRVTNQLWNGTANVLANTKNGFWKSLSKIENPDSPVVVVKTLSNESMANLHDVFKIGKELDLDHTTNLKQNGQHLTPLEQKSYTILAKLFDDMHTEALKKQQALGLKHELPYTQGWYAASRRGQYSIAISYGDLLAHYETFATRRAAESALANLKNNHKFKFLEISDIMDASKGQEKTPNKEMADAIATKLNQAFPNAGQAIRDEIAAMVENMEKKNGKLGHHHEHRSNVSGYKGSEIGLSRAERGKSFKEGIQLEVTNFTSNIKALDIKTKLKAYVEDADEQRKSPIEHAAISQMYDSQLGRNADLLGDRIDGVAEHVTSSVDRMANNVMMKTLGIEFKGREKSILKGGYEAAMRGFYATKLLAKPMFALGQVLTTAMIIPEMAQNNHPIRAFYSFGKGMTKLLAHDKKLMDVLFRESQEYGTIEPQLRESLGLDRHTGIESNVAKTVNAIEDYALLGKLGTMADSLSRAVSFATAYTHFTDLGMGETQARYEARRITGHAMNENGKNMAAPMYSKMGVVGEAMRPLTSFSQNQLGNLAKYYKQMLKGDAGPMLAVGLIATATGGIIGLPFMQEYERARQILASLTDIQMPSMLEIMYGDESFLDRLEINPADTQMLKDAVTYGAIPALTGIDFTATGRTNETVFSVMASVLMGQQEAWKLLPIIGATVDVGTGLYGLQRAVRGKGTEAEDRKSVDKIISGPIGFAAKRALGAGRTRLFGENTDMLSTGASGNADIQAGDKAVVAGLFGAKTLEQRKVDQQAFEMASEDKRLKDKLTRAKTMYVETGKPEYMQKMLALGLNQEQIVNAIQTGVYDKLVDQRIRYIRSSKGKVDIKKLMHAIDKGAI